MKFWPSTSGLCLVCAAAAPAAPPAYHDAVGADKPILWYQFNETEGSPEAVNHGALGAAFNGVYTNGVSLEAATPDGDSAACFNSGLGQYVESKAAAPDAMLGNPDFTSEAVVRLFAPNQSGYYPPFLHWGINATGGSVFFGLRGSEGDRAFVGFYNGGLRMTEQFEVGAWVHLVWVRDSGAGANNERTGSTLYVNGEPAGLTVDENGCCSFVPTVGAGPFRVNRAGGDAARFFTGDVDEVALYDRLLSPDEVRAHYEALVGSAPCAPDLNKDGVLDLFDFLAYVNMFNAKDPRADCSPSGCEAQLDLFDFLCYVNRFNAGC